MSFGKNINNVLVSVFNKEKLETILALLKKNNSNIIKLVLLKKMGQAILNQEYSVKNLHEFLKKELTN